ncbi:MAG: hypothetical protein M3Q58_04315 [Bacteroidota bacterium]|nr:hypothetical protein [Bacteroidota bacterium]
MSFFDDLFKKVFSKENNAQNIDVRENLIRRDDYINDYLKWKETNKPKEYLKVIKNTFKLKQSGVESDLHLSIYRSVYANGFFFSYNNDLDKNEFLYIFDYLKETILDLGYYLSTSDKRTREKNNYIEEIQKHYLKPQQKTYEGVLEQLYGNVLIEHVAINNKPSYIKVMANIYSDSKFKKALEFDDFIEKLLGRD